MVRIKKFQVKILSNGRELTEYDVPDESPDNNTRRVYIEAEESAEFQFQLEVDRSYKLKHRHRCLTMDCYVDGNYRSGFYCDRQDLRYSKPTWRRVVNGCTLKENNVWIKRPFVFRTLSTNDDAVVLSGSELKKYEEIGQLEVKVWLVNRVNKCDIETSNVITPASIPEKALKGRPIHLGAQLGAASPVDAPNFCEFSVFKDKPEAVFIFLYRSRAALQMLEIIEKSPEPVSLEDREPETLTRDEMLELISQMRVKREVEDGIKQENSQHAGIPTRVKHIIADDDSDDDEIEVVSVKRVKTAEIEIVDLD